MKKRILAVIMTIAMLLGLLSAGVLAADTQVHILDTSSQYTPYTRQFGQVYSVETNEKVLFSYPSTGTTVVLFFSAGNCSNSKNLFDELGRTAWATRDDINIIAVESTGASRSTVQQFLKDTHTDDLVTAYYRNSLACWYAELVKRGGNMQGVNSVSGGGSTVSALLIQTENNQPYIQYQITGASRLQVITNRLANLVSLDETPMNTVNVTVPGTYCYGNVKPVFNLINAHRKTQGVEALTLSKSLTELAMHRAAECALSFSHDRPNGTSCFTVSLDGVTYYGHLTAENIASGYATPDAVMTGWKNSPGHNANMLNSTHNQIGIGCFENNRVLYWVQLFGSGQDWITPPTTEKRADVTVDCLRDVLDPALSALEDFTAPVNSSIVLPTMYNANGNTLLRPIVSSTIGTVTVEPNTGKATLTSSKAGSGTVSMRAYEGMEPFTLKVTFTGATTPSKPNSGSQTKPQKNGWTQTGLKWYYYQNNKSVTGWKQIGGTWYYFDASGEMATDWKQIGSTWYYLGGGGAMVTDWKEIGGTWYYFDGSGAMRTGWLDLNGTWYYLEDSGAMQTGWLNDGAWYYLNNSGAMSTGWTSVDGIWYYMNGSGVMQTGWFDDGGTWYYLYDSGSMATGWVCVDGTWYYMDGSGVMQTGWLNDGGTWYYLDSSGAWVE